ncbi:ATP-binding protein [Aerococcus urinae]|uniref:ATP-binding protein n=1 Tax=Aerococcus urinae TaxID=1376 RepID=UPI000DCCB7CB|nr:ATP-binding protein [Aerococcus urinae]
MSKTKSTKGRYVSPDQLNNKQGHSDIFSIEKPQKSLDDIILSKSTREQINSLLAKIKHHDLLYNTFGLKEIDLSGGRTAINLYGPPGTGKSATAEAIAYELGKDILRANYAEIESKFVGETPKNIKAIFAKATETDAVLIFDEADSLLSKRLAQVNQSTDQAVNVTKSVLLLELDNFSGIVIFTTNFGENYDLAFIRRILGHIEFSLPEKEARTVIFKHFLPDKLPVSIDKAEKDKIILETSGFSGGDLLNVVISASSTAVARDGKDCMVTYNDFSKAIKLIKQAKENIGRSK